MITWYLHFQAAAAAADGDLKNNSDQHEHAAPAADGDLKNNSDQHEHAAPAPAADGDGDLKNNSDQHEHAAPAADVSFRLPTGVDIDPLIVFMEVNPNQI